MADASTNSVPPKCAKCSKDKSDSGQGLKRCGRCKLAHYCSRECQKADWKNHKTLCGSTGHSPSPPSTLSPSTSTTPPQHLFSIDRPFHRLQSRTWLHDRPEHDVFVLLIDAYRCACEINLCLNGRSRVTAFMQAPPMQDVVSSVSYASRKERMDCSHCGGHQLNLPGVRRWG